MSRQDANAAFARTSFLYGGNADYIEDLYARYETARNAVDAQWQGFFASLRDTVTRPGDTVTKRSLLPPCLLALALLALIFLTWPGWLERCEPTAKACSISIGCSRTGCRRKPSGGL